MEAQVPLMLPLIDEAEDAKGILTTKNGKKAMQYRKNEEDIKDEELAKLLESAYACIEQDIDANASKDQEIPPKAKIILVIDMLEKLRKIKKLMAEQGKQSQDMTDFKCFIRTNKSQK